MITKLYAQSRMKRTMWNVMIKEVTVDIQIILILTVWDFRRMKINTLLGDPMEIVGERVRGLVRY